MVNGNLLRKYKNFIKKYASWLHDNYEELSIKNNWDTQENCKLKPFNDLPHENQITMIEVTERLFDLFSSYKGELLIKEYKKFKKMINNDDKTKK